MMIFIDPPRHDRLRKLVSRAFTPAPHRRARAIRSRDGRPAARSAAPSGGGDFVKELSTPLPMDVIFTLLGVPDGRSRTGSATAWTCRSSATATPPSIPQHALEAMVEMMQYWVEFVRARCAGGRTTA